MKKLAWLAALALCACVTTGTTLMEPQNVTASYRATRVTMNSNWGPYVVTLRYRTFETGGKTAMCVQASGDPSLVQGDLFHAYFKEAMLLLDDGEFGTGGFIRLVPTAEARDRQATCVRSELAWKPSHANTALNWRGGPVRVVY